MVRKIFWRVSRLLNLFALPAEDKGLVNVAGHHHKNILL